ncbi:elongation factor P maturation arginine rhamnosyltransferase EarP, partial [Leptospira sp. 96542]|nr:elongation factor P maturation arginine rhamnosyltransferase EarP [Leptospira sp. 96542]
RAAAKRETAWMNLEYLGAEAYVERMHGLPSPVLSGPLSGWRKCFFYPGFTPATGGLLREPDLPRRQQGFDRDAWLAAQGIQRDAGARLVSLFCYEPEALPALLDQWARPDGPTEAGGQETASVTHLLVTAGRATAAVQALGPDHPPSPRLRIHYLPRLSQDDYDHLLWACDLNFVRGEDSLVRALWAARPDAARTLRAIPFVWQIYPQQDDAHHAKLRAFLDWLLPQDRDPGGLRAFHMAWNGLQAGPLPPLAWSAWAEANQAARTRLLMQTDLCTQLQTLVQTRPSSPQSDTHC